VIVCHAVTGGGEDDGCALPYRWIVNGDRTQQCPELALVVLTVYHVLLF
jgi:hypothetical protein